MYSNKMLKYVNHSAVLIKAPMLLRILALDHLLWDLIYFSMYEENFQTDCRK